MLAFKARCHYHCRVVMLISRVSIDDDKCALVVKWISRGPPEAKLQVRSLPRAPFGPFPLLIVSTNISKMVT